MPAEQQVVGLDVAMHHALFVGESQAPGRLQYVAHGNLGVELALALQQIGQRLPLDEFHAEKVRAALGANVVDLHHVMMVQLGRRIGFARETSDKDRVFGPFGPHEFDGHVAIQRHLPRQVDGAHAAAPQFLQHLVTAQRRRYVIQPRSPDLGAQRKPSCGVKTGPFGRVRRWRRRRIQLRRPAGRKSRRRLRRRVVTCWRKLRFGHCAGSGLRRDRRRIA